MIFFLKTVSLYRSLKRNTFFAHSPWLPCDGVHVYIGSPFQLNLILPIGKFKLNELAVKIEWVFKLLKFVFIYFLTLFSS